MRIRGVIHICQVGPWQRSLNMILNALTTSGLYDATEHIDFCIVADSEPDTSFQISKSKCIVVGEPSSYERPTLLHLRGLAVGDTEEVFYWYIHTKGLRWFGTDKEENIIDWINLLLHWNVREWKQAVRILAEGYDTYGCNQYQTEHIPNHYSGNFWWSKSSYLKTLPSVIGSTYNDPEFWIMKSTAKWYCIFRSGLEGMGHYENRYPTFTNSQKYIEMQIVFVSGHHPSDVPFAQITRELFRSYTERHGYGFYYDDTPSPPEEQQWHHLHYRRCVSIKRAAVQFPNAEWFVWVDSDVLVNKPDVRVEECIDLTDKNILYHLFHEQPWDYPINTGVKFVNRKALHWEATVYAMRNMYPWNQFPFEQKTITEYVIPRIEGKYKIHDPYILNHILYQLRPVYHDPKEALFVHVCNRSTEQRNKIMSIFVNEHRLMDHSEDPSIRLS